MSLLPKRINREVYYKVQYKRRGLWFDFDGLVNPDGFEFEFEAFDQIERVQADNPKLKFRVVRVTKIFDLITK